MKRPCMALALLGWTLLVHPGTSSSVAGWCDRWQMNLEWDGVTPIIACGIDADSFELYCWGAAAPQIPPGTRWLVATRRSLYSQHQTTICGIELGSFALSCIGTAANAPTGQYVAAAFGYDHTCAIALDTRGMVCSGSNEYEELAIA